MPREPLSRAEAVDLPFRLILVGECTSGSRKKLRLPDADGPTAPIAILFNVIRCVFLAWSRGLPLRFYTTCGFLRVLLLYFTPRQKQLLLPSTLELYRSWIPQRRARARKARETAVIGRLAEDIEPLPDGRSSIMWLGDRRRATRFVLFFHGGGYVAWMAPGHLEWCLQAYMLADEEVEVAVAVLQYTMCPAAQYPVQLQQASAALAHLLAHGIDPGQIVVGGDSAGANLTAQLLGHLLHPHPGVEPVDLATPLRAAFAVSPWVSTSINTPSFRENKHIDMLSPELIADLCRTAFAGTTHGAEEEQGHGWAMPVDADESWFDGLGGVTRALYVTVGRHEILRDQGLVFGDRIRGRNEDVRVTLEVGDDEAHDFVFVEGMQHVVCGATVRMRNWFRSVIGR